MEKKKDELLNFYHSSETKNKNGITLTFVRGQGEGREFFRCFVPYETEKGAIWAEADGMHINLRKPAAPYEAPKAKEKTEEASSKPEWFDALPGWAYTLD